MVFVRIVFIQMDLYESQSWFEVDRMITAL